MHYLDILWVKSHGAIPLKHYFRMSGQKEASNKYFPDVLMINWIKVNWSLWYCTQSALQRKVSIDFWGCNWNHLGVRTEKGPLPFWSNSCPEHVKCWITSDFESLKAWVVGQYLPQLFWVSSCNSMCPSLTRKGQHSGRFKAL